MSQGHCVDEKDVCPSIFISIERIHAELSKHFPLNMSNYVINIGANDGIWADPLYPLVAKGGSSGLFLEYDGALFSKLQRNYATFGAKTTLLQEAVTINNIAEIYSRSNQQTGLKSVDIFKIDFDGCECHLLERLLETSNARPKIIQVELSPLVPPPFVYKEMCDENEFGRWSRGNPFSGCSVQAAYDVLKRHGYELLQFDWPDGVFVDSRFSAAFPYFTLSAISMKHHFHIGHVHAQRFYTRFRSMFTQPKGIQFEKRAETAQFLRSLPKIARSITDPAESLREFINVHLGTSIRNRGRNHIRVEYAYQVRQRMLLRLQG